MSESEAAKLWWTENAAAAENLRKFKLDDGPYKPDKNIKVDIDEYGVVYITGDNTYMVMSLEYYRYLLEAAKAESAVDWSSYCKRKEAE